LVKPDTVIGLAVPVPVLEDPDAVQVAVYEVIVAPPFEAGAVKAIDALPSPAVAVPMVGAPGTVVVVPPPVELPSPPHPASMDVASTAPRKFNGRETLIRSILTLLHAIPFQLVG
jgi:hypothetical protein